MKKIILSSMLFAAAAIALVSCHKSETAPEKKLVSLTFTSANPGTKTEYNGETIVWSKGDVIRMACTANGVWQEQNGNVGEGGDARLYTVNIADQISYETANFTLHSFYANATPGPYEFYTVYPSSAKNGTAFKAPLAEIAIPTQQNSSAETFDKTADILWGKAALAYNELPTEAIPLLWNRVVAHAYITLENIKGITDGEVIKSVKLTAQEGASLVGTYNLNMVTGEFTPNAPSNSIEVISTDSSTSFWACVNPCTINSLEIEVKTDKAKYSASKTGFSREFIQNRRNLLSINMSEATRESLEAPITVEGYTRIENLNEIVSGEYIIACDVNGTYYAASTAISSNALQGIALTLNDKTLSFPENAADHVFYFTRTNNYVTIKANNQYLAKKNSGTGLEYKDTETTACHWNLVTSAASQTILQPNGHNRYLMYNYTANASGFKAAGTTASDAEYKHLVYFKKN